MPLLLTIRLYIVLLAADSFTDTAISSKSNPNGSAAERELLAWEPDSEMPEGEALDQHTVNMKCYD